MLIEHTQASKVKIEQPEYMQEESDDYIMIDGKGQLENVGAWGTLWYAFTTAKQKSAPKYLKATNETENSVVLSWKKDRCVSFGYSVSFASGDHKGENAFCTQLFFH